MENILLYSNILLWITQIIVIVSLVIIFKQFGDIYLKSSDAISRDGVPIGDAIPKFQGLSYNSGKYFSKKDMENVPTLIGFISPNCPACKDLIPDWNRAITKYKGKVNFLLIGVGTNRDQYTEFLKNRQLNGELILDPDNIGQAFRVRVTPFAFMVDENGVVLEKGLCNDEKHINHLISASKNPTKLVEMGV